MHKRKIAVITCSRADYGLLYWIIKGIQEDTDLELQLTVTGMHISPELGLTIKEIEKDGFPIIEKVEMLLSSDTEEAIAVSMGLGLIGFAKAYSKLKPDIIIVLGDRFEIHSAVSAAIPFRIPIAHIHGGESTEGLIDELIRHSITKMSHIHFASAEKYKRRIIQMGEKPENVFCYGAPGIDNIFKLNLLNRDSLCEDQNLPKDNKIGVVTFHPVTLELNTAESQISELLEALQGTEGIYWAFTFPNADTSGRVIIGKIEEFVKKNPKKRRVFVSMGQQRYLSLLKNASVMVGNSSSGIIEAPAFQLPVVNIGDRQKGRIKDANVIDVKECKKELILKAIKKAISIEFSESLKGLKNSYGPGNSSQKIIRKIKEAPLGENLIKKHFHNILQ